MYNWSTNTKRLKNNPQQYDIFELEQLINFGLNNQKISLAKLRKYWHQIDIDPNKRAYLKRIVWPQS